MNNGWVRIHRKIFDNIIWQNDKALKIWIWCLLKANHQDKECLIGRKKVLILRGQFLFGGNKAKFELGMSKSTIHYWMSFLKVERYIERKTTSRYSIISILNYDKYQSDECQTTPPQNDKRTISVLLKETNKNVKNDKNDKEVILYSPESIKLSKLLYELIKENNPAWYVKPNFDTWAEDIDKIIRIDGRTAEQIDWLIRWCQSDDFWAKNILSPSKLRKQFNTLVVQAKNKQKKVLEIKR